MYFFFAINNTYSPFYNALISIVDNAIILFFLGFSSFNIIGIIIEISINVKLIVSLILGSICALSSPILYRRNKIKREKGIFQKITKKKKLKLKEYERKKKNDENIGNDKIIKEIEKSNSSSLIRKRKSYNNEEESTSSRTTDNTSNSDEGTTISSNDNESNSENDTNNQDSTSSGESENTYSENRSDLDSIDSFKRKLSKDALYESIETIVETIALREPIIVYSRPCECELISRFIRYNNSHEALMALDEIFNEGMSQYPKNSSLRLSYCILFWYLEGCINQVNDEWGIYNSDDDIYKKKTEKDYKLIERINESIQQVYELKPNISSRYKIAYLKNIIEEDKEKQHDYEM
eukprot:jgi/Orpsp1_1/1190007/evm.model.d7180000076074.1